MSNTDIERRVNKLETCRSELSKLKAKLEKPVNWAHKDKKDIISIAAIFEGQEDPRLNVLVLLNFLTHVDTNKYQPSRSRPDLKSRGFAARGRKRTIKKTLELAFSVAYKSI